MIVSEFFNIFSWYISFLLIGISFLPLTFYVFRDFKDKGYIFSKIIGSSFLAYVIFLAGFTHILEFSTPSVYFSLFVLIVINYSFSYLKKFDIFSIVKKNIRLFIFEEFLFFFTLLLWSFVRGTMPDIQGLEKFMDFGFLNSILRTDYFPPKDMWYTPFSINYYYFGHLITAVVTKISFVPSFISYNLMIATLFALTFTASFSIGINFFEFGKRVIKPFIAGILAGTLISLGGNLTTVYSFFKPYFPADKPVPFWNLNFLPFNFPNDYWYPNATRFIPFTIHEFPIYSFVVSDLHGHVLDIPFVLLTIAIMLSLFLKSKLDIVNFKLEILLISFLLAIMYMTNAWDAIIYFVLFSMVILYLNFNSKIGKWSFTIKGIYESLKNLLFVFIGFLLFSAPFSIHFKPFVSGIGIICAPQLLTTIGKLGPFIFEANHCQNSPFWQLILLYGFFYFFIFLFLLFLKFKKNYIISKTDYFILIIILLSSVLIVIPEFIYVKDIYPLHYRANTMFKLTYESFIMLSLACSLIIIKLLSNIKNKILRFSFFLVSLILISLVLIYPVLSINSYYRGLKYYKGLNGTSYVKQNYPGDYNLINWINKNIKNQPVILEANGDSYSNYARISANTGLPTVLGWTVHEWLWRGTYNIVSPRISDIKTLYTSEDIKLVSNLIKKYKISYVVVSDLEREKYPEVNEKMFEKLGQVIFASGQTKLYKINFSK